MKNKRTAAILAGCAATAVISLAACGSSGSHAGSALSASASRAAVANAMQRCQVAGNTWNPAGSGSCIREQATTAAPAPATTAPTAPATPAVTATQQQAVDAAQGYLALGTGFSYNGLIKQLTSQYGNGFSQSAAAFAVSYLHPDWDQQAVEAAKGYMNLGTGFSRNSLIAQLTSSYGSGFTYGQASYAADQVGL